MHEMHGIVFAALKWLTGKLHHSPKERFHLEQDYGSLKAGYAFVRLQCTGPLSLPVSDRRDLDEFPAGRKREGVTLPPLLPCSRPTVSDGSGSPSAGRRRRRTLRLSASGDFGLLRYGTACWTVPLVRRRRVRGFDKFLQENLKNGNDDGNKSEPRTQRRYTSRRPAPAGKNTFEADILRD